MIDIENKVIQIVSTALTGKYPNIEILSDMTQTPSKFPCVFINEADNYVYQRTIDSGSNENHVELMYEINAYTNDTAGKKSKCKAIFAVADEAMLNLGFIRLAKTNIPTNNGSYYRIVGRYVAVADKNNTIYRR